MALISKKPKYYRLDRILENEAYYYIVIGERSNGKTYAVLEYCLKRYFELGEQFAIVRRWQDDLRGKRGATMFSNLVENGVITKLSKGEYNNVYYYSGRWFLCNINEKGERMTAPEPFCYGFAISAAEHDKSTSYPNVTSVLFDEFITRGMYLQDEFVSFMSVLSTIIRQRNNVKVFMCANTVNQYGCPYFVEMGIDIKKLKQGDIAVFNYGESSLKVAIEYCESGQKNGGKASDVYFAFNNPKLQMVTGGAWEMEIYPHCPCKFRPKDITLVFFVKYDDVTLQCELVEVNDMSFIYIHRKTTPIQKPDQDIIFSTEWNSRPNYYRNILKATDKLTTVIKRYFATDKVFYQDNPTGELMRAYLQWCKAN